MIAVNEKDETLWTYNGDHLRRWSAEHRRQLQRWAEDAKYENRPLANFAERRGAAVKKFHDRMQSVTHEIAAQLAGYAARRRFAAVEYNDSDQSFMEGGAWHRLRTLLAEKLDAYNIKLSIASGPEERKTPEPLAEEKDATES